MASKASKAGKKKGKNKVRKGGVDLDSIPVVPFYTDNEAEIARLSYRQRRLKQVPSDVLSRKDLVCHNNAQSVYKSGGKGGGHSPLTCEREVQRW